MSALPYGIICADCARSTSGLCGVHSNRTILFAHAFPGLGHTESREAARDRLIGELRDLGYTVEAIYDRDKGPEP